MGALKSVTAALTVLCVALAAMGLSAPASSARVYEGEISGLPQNAPQPGPFVRPGPLTTDSSGNLWMGDIQGFEARWINKLDLANEFQLQILPSPQTWDYGGGLEGLAYSNVNDELYVGDRSGRNIYSFRPDGTFVADRTGSWGQAPYIAVDNSGESTDGTIYTASTEYSYEVGDYIGRVQRRGSNFEPSNFSASAPYIDGYQLKGSPTKAFGNILGLATDAAGALYVVGEASNAVLKFDSSGQFVREFAQTPGGPFGRPKAVAVDPITGQVLIADNNDPEELGPGVIHEFDASGTYLGDLTGTPTGAGGTEESFGPLFGLAFNPIGDLYASDTGRRVVHVFRSGLKLPKVTYGEVTNQTQTSGTLTATVDPNGGGDIVECYFQFGVTTAYTGSIPCEPGPPFNSPTAVEADLSGLTTEVLYHYRVVMRNGDGPAKGADQVFVPHAVLGLNTDPASDITPTSARLNGSWFGNDEETHYHFQWGETNTYGKVTAVPPGESAGATNGQTSVFFDLENLTPTHTYHYRLRATNSKGTTTGQDQSFTVPPRVPLIDQWVTEVHSDTAALKGMINPGGATTIYRFEYGAQPCSVSECEATSDIDIGGGLSDKSVGLVLDGLEPGTTYYYRIVAQNSQATIEAPDRTLTTFPLIPVLDDPCPNALVRQQTSAALLPECRAYELVSASNAGGYDVESDLGAGHEPLPGYPFAGNPSRVLYAMHLGAIPGSGHPTNFGPDPYVATRNADGWQTRYVGISANGTPDDGSFASTLGEATPSLDAFAFSGSKLCSPCFPDGKTGLPVRTPAGDLVQGMAGSLDPGEGANADILVRKRFSADGRYLIFGSISQFEPDAPNGQPAIYRRDLEQDTTKVVSKTPGGANIACLSNCTSNGVEGLDISADGSRVLIGQLLTTDADANNLFHPYINVDGASTSIDLAPGTTSGVSYAGMTSDGTKVFFTSADQLTGDDNDDSVDLFRADVGASSATLTKLSSTNNDACDPGSNSGGAHWNSVGAGASCSVAVIAGGGGLANREGTLYFLSPELLDGSNGEADQPNLYVLKPGQTPAFVTTLEPNNPAVLGGVNDADVRRTADFQVTLGGEFAAFASRLPLTGFDNNGHAEIYRYEPSSKTLECTSCAQTGVRATGNSSMALQGLSLTEDGRVFFTSSEPLSARDLSGRDDVYEWIDGKIELISNGTSLFDSSLLSASADGTDAYFFTREILAPQDQNGQLIKIYDAREGGGFQFPAPSVPCQASDECHGAGTKAAGPLQIGTYLGTGGNAKPAGHQKARKCKRARKRGGKCVRRKHRRARARSSR